MRHARSFVLLAAGAALLGCSESTASEEPSDVEPVVEVEDEPDRADLLDEVMVALNVRYYYDESVQLEEALDHVRVFSSRSLLEVYDFQQGWFHIRNYWVENDDQVVIETSLDENGEQQMFSNREIAFRICGVVRSEVEWASTVEVTDKYGGRIAMCGRNPSPWARG